MARLQAHPVARQRLSQPRHSQRRVAKHRLGRPLLDALAIDNERDRSIAQDVGQAVRVGRGAGFTQHEAGGAGVVGDRVNEADLPGLDAAVDEFECGHDVVGCGKHVIDAQARPGQRSLQHESDLGFGARGDEPPGRDRVTVGHRHVGEQVAVVRGVDAEHLLHRQRGQADLVPDDDATRGKAPIDVEELDLVGIGGVELRPRRAQGGDGANSRLSFRQESSDLLAHLRPAHGCSRDMAESYAALMTTDKRTP